MNTYSSLEQRTAHAYLDLFPPFAPLETAAVSVGSQEQFYRFMEHVFRSLFDSPEILFTTLHEDDAYPNRFNRSSYQKPKLYTIYKRITVEIDDLLGLLFSLGQTGVVDGEKMVLPETGVIKKKYQTVLQRLGLSIDHRIMGSAGFGSMFAAWQWMASRENANVLTFSRCMFDPAYPYLQKTYARLFGHEAVFAEFEQYLAQQGYQCAVLARGAHTLDYFKQSEPGEHPLGGPLHGDHFHYGFSAEYKAETAVPPFMVLRILEMKNMLLNFNNMPDGLQSFIVKKAKKCDLCGYCTQTDKTGKRQPIYVPVKYDAEYLICPLYQGFSFCFSELDEGLAANLKAFLEFMDQTITSKNQKTLESLQN